MCRAKIFLIIIFLTSCTANQNNTIRFDGGWLIHGQLQPMRTSSTQTASSPNHTPTLAIVLGGGGLRGYAHIGVLQALEEANIHPDLVVGTSIGSIIGALYASGHSPNQIWHIANNTPMLSFADLTFHGPGFVKGDALEKWLNKQVGNKQIEQFPIKYAAVTTDLDRSLPFVITGGNASQAERASSAIPGVFLPVYSGKNMFVDGGVTSLVPIRAARALGADIIIGVDIYCHSPRYASSSALGMWLKVSQVQSCILAEEELKDADIVIAPSVKPASINDAESREIVRMQGYQAAQKVLPTLKAILQQHPVVTFQTAQSSE